MADYSKMLENNAMLAINVKLWTYFSVIFPRRGNNWRVFALVLPIWLMNIMEMLYLIQMRGDLMQFILNAFFTTVIFNAVARICFIIINRNKFETFLIEMLAMYEEIEQSRDKNIQKILNDAVAYARKITLFNLKAAVCNIMATLIYPLICEGRVHPFGVSLPGVDMTAFPVYEIIYAMQFLAPLTLTVTYMPFVNLFTAFALFGKAALMILQYRIQMICDHDRMQEDKFMALRSCIAEYNRVTVYTKKFNSLVTHIFLAEYLLFGTIICTLLFCINVLETFTQIISVVMYIFTMMYILFMYYWHAHEIAFESVKVSEAASAIPWYYCDRRFRLTLQLFIMRTQKPLQLKIGNIYPMSLTTFQGLLKTSYSYFTMLHGLYSQK